MICKFMDAHKLYKEAGRLTGSQGSFAFNKPHVTRGICTMCLLKTQEQ